MQVSRALEIVLELAWQNIADQLDHPHEHQEQEEACALVEVVFKDLKKIGS